MGPKSVLFHSVFDLGVYIVNPGTEGVSGSCCEVLSNVASTIAV
jgi:hypothetical protein